MLKLRWLLPLLHILLFCPTWITAFFLHKPLMDGPSGLSFDLLLLADLPFSILGFSMMWDGKFFAGLILWRALGTIWWYVLGWGVERLRKAAGQ